MKRRAMLAALMICAIMIGVRYPTFAETTQLGTIPPYRIIYSTTELRDVGLMRECSAVGRGGISLEKRALPDVSLALSLHRLGSNHQGAMLGFNGPDIARAANRIAVTVQVSVGNLSSAGKLSKIGPNAVVVLEPGFIDGLAASNGDPVIVDGGYITVMVANPKLVAADLRKCAAERL